MGLRETLNQNPQYTTIGTIALTVIAIGLIVWQLLPASPPRARPPITQYYYSDDDGQTWFADDMAKIPPFMGPKGKEAVRARVWQCGSGKPFVAYLEKFDPQVKSSLEMWNRNPRNKGVEHPEMFMFRNQAVQVKKPGTKDWFHIVRQMPLAEKIRNYQCDGNQEGRERYPGDVED